MPETLSTSQRRNGHHLGRLGGGFDDSCIAAPESGPGSRDRRSVCWDRDRFGINRALVRVAFVILGLMGPGVFAYIVLWILIPSSDQQLDRA